jgi:N-acetylmuramoyl-L-alanine amidase
MSCCNRIGCVAALQIVLWVCVWTSALQAASETRVMALNELKSERVQVVSIPANEGEKRVVTVRAKGREVLFREDDACFWVNGIKVDLPGRIVWHTPSEGLALATGWNELYVQPLLEKPAARTSAKKKPVLFIDPGHGGSQQGCKGQDIGLIEKDLTLKVSLLLKELMEQRGWKVVLSRDKDQLLGLRERSKQANQVNADLFLSVHFNAAPNRQARGIEMFTLRPEGEVTNGADVPVALPGNRYNSENLKLAWHLQKAAIQKTGWSDRGVRRGNFVVLKELAMPGVLAELGFLTHTEEEALIAKPETQLKLAEGLRDGLLAWWNGE